MATDEWAAGGVMTGYLPTRGNACIFSKETPDMLMHLAISMGGSTITLNNLHPRP